MATSSELRRLIHRLQSKQQMRWWQIGSRLRNLQMPSCLNSCESRQTVAEGADVAHVHKDQFQTVWQLLTKSSNRLTPSNTSRMPHLNRERQLRNGPAIS